ncbi:MAG: extracellular solute-binding protein [Chloroflexota bacterium]|nr:extracellular solute-binding protein [Chloroflexota bacterium]
MALTLLFVNLSACISSGNTPDEPTSLVFACDQSESNVYQNAAETFHQANPAIKVRVISLDGIISFPLEDETDTLGPVRQIASRADTFLWSASGTEGGPAGLVLDLRPFIEADSELTEADFLSGLPAHFQWQGGTWGLPAGVEPLVVFYDAVVFEEAGLGPPGVGWTWNDLQSTAQRLTQWEGEQVVRYGFADLWRAGLVSAIEAQGGRLVDASITPPVPTLNDPHTVAAVQWYVDLALAHRIMVDPTQVEGRRPLALLLDGKAAMEIDVGSSWAMELSNHPSIEVTSLPGRSPAAIQGYFISAGTAHPEAAWRWLQFLSRQVAPPNQLPARQDLISGSTYAVSAGEKALEVFQYAAEHTLLPPRPGATQTSLYKALDQIFAGDDVNDALAGAQQQAVALHPPATAEPFVVPTPASIQLTEESITFVATWDPPAYQALAEAFQESDPEIKIVVQSITDYFPEWSDASHSPATLFAASPADCTLDIAATSDATRQAVLNLQPFIDTDSSFPLNDYAPWALEAVRYGNDLWGLPAGVVLVGVLYYDKALFEEAGLPYPTADWTWNELLLAAKRVVARERGEVQTFGLALWPSDASYLLEAMAGRLVDDPAAPITFRFDSPEARTVAQQLAELVTAGAVPPFAEFDDKSDQEMLYDLIRDGQVGMWFGNYMRPNLWSLEERGHRVSVVPPPRGDRAVVGHSPVMAYYIAADTPHAEACWQWLKFISGHVVESSLPLRRSLVVSNTFRELEGEQVQTAYLATFAYEDAHTFHDLQGLPYSGRAYVWLEKALGEILWHGADAQAALSQAQRKAEAYLDCLRQRPDSENEASAEACFQQVDAP